MFPVILNRTIILGIELNVQLDASRLLHWIIQARRELERSPVQPLAESQVTWKIRLGCSELCPYGSWKPLRLETALFPPLLPDCHHGENSRSLSSSKLSFFTLKRAGCLSFSCEALQHVCFAPSHQSLHSYWGAAARSPPPELFCRLNWCSPVSAEPPAVSVSLCRTYLCQHITCMKGSKTHHSLYVWTYECQIELWCSCSPGCCWPPMPGTFLGHA